jgi:hypothetical protein
VDHECCRRRHDLTSRPDSRDPEAGTITMTAAASVPPTFGRERFGDWVFGRPLTPTRPLLQLGVVLAILFIAGIVITIFRLPADQRNVLWAEDGNQFLVAAFHADYFTNLFTPYAGYMHFVPRTAAQIVAAFVPTAYLGIAMNLAGAAVWSAVAVAAFVFTRDRIQTPLRWLLWLLVLILPIGSFEVATNISNSHWFLMFGLFIALSARSGQSIPRTVFASVLIASAVMSDPLSLVFAPLVVARVVGLPRLRENIVSIVFAAAAIVQILMTLGTERDRGGPVLDPFPLGSTYLVRVVWGDLLGAVDGTTLYNALGRHPVLVLAGALIVSLVVLIVIRWRRTGLAALALAGSVGFYGVVAVLTWTQFGLQPPGSEVYWGGRYLVVPSLLLITSLLAVLSVWLPGPGGSRSRVIRRAVAFVVVAALLITPGLLNFRMPAYKAGVPELTTSVEDLRPTCAAAPSSQVEVPIGPAGFTFAVPCERILAG